VESETHSIGYKKVYCREFFKISTCSARFLPPAAKAGHADAQYSLGLLFENGKGVTANPAKAVEWMGRGMLLLILQNINTLNALLSPAMEAEHPDAFQWMKKGMLLQNSLNINILSALISLAVESGHRDAFDRIQKGILSRILQNINTLSALLSPAAKAGHAGAFKQMQKGILSRILQMSTYSARLFRQPRKRDMLKRLNGCKKVSLSRILRTLTHSARFIRQLRKQDYRKLKTVSGICFPMVLELRRIRSKRLNGIKKVCCREFFKNINTLSAVLSPAAEARIPEAQFNLAQIFEFGKGVKVNLVKAFEWYQDGMLSRTL
jgi:TPR repeat protein